MRWLWALASCVVVAAISWAFAPILENSLVWDDGANLIAARPFWDAGVAGVDWAFRSAVAGHYQPLTWISYRLDSLISGATPRGLHTTQILLHLLATVGVAALAATLARTTALASRAGLRGAAFPLLAAAVFGVTPIHVESVAWATERRDLLGAVLTIAAVLVHLRTAPRDTSISAGRWWVALLAAASALSRAQATLWVVLLLLDLWPLGRLQVREPGFVRGLLRLVEEKAILIAVGSASAVAALWAQTDAGALTAVAEHGLAARLVQVGYSLAFYPVATLLPWAFDALLPLYQRPSPLPMTPWPFVGPAVAALLASGALLRRRAGAVSTAWWSYVALVLPVTGLAQSGIQIVADRYAYLATVPIVLLVTGGIASAASRWVKWQQVAVWLLLIAGLASMALTTRRQTSVWRSDETFWRHVLDHAPSSLADNNLGQILLAQGEPGQALFHLVRSLEQSPAYPRPWRAVGKILELPPTPDAPPSAWVAAILERGLRHQPGLVSARYASALAMVRSGRIEHGRRELELVLRLDPQHSGARLALARLQRPSTGDASESRGGVGVGRQGEASEGRSSGL